MLFFYGFCTFARTRQCFCSVNKPYKLLLVMKKLLLTIIVTLSVIFSNASEGPYSIMGFFYYKNGGLTPLDHVKVVLLQNGQPVDSTLTSNTGFYLFSGLADNTYIIEGYCTKPWGSVNGTDALKIERQFTGIDTITLPVILNAADVNNSGSVNGTDAVKTKRRFVGMDNSFLRGNWTFAKPAGGNSVTLSGGSIRQDFYGLCVGDVNGSNIPLPTQELPTVRTVDASAITQYAATSGGNVFSDGGQEVTDRGVCWSVSQNPTTADPHTSDGNGMGVFSSSLSGLTPGTLYYLRAYANNSLGTGYGNQVSFSTAPPFACGQTLTDMRDGSNYSTVTIGTQCWMAQNMNIGNRIYSADAQTNHAAIEKYCYNNLDTNCSVYGGLYQWDNTVQWESPSIKQGICPSGWHVPSDAEWSALANFLGGPAAAGGKLKESGFLHWADPNTDATNTSGFTALPGGSRSYYMSPFEDMNQAAYFWTSSRDYDSIAWFRKLSYDNGSLMRISDGFKTYGFSVRCIKGGIPTIITASIIDILHLTATGGGNIISDGENTITGRGICWNTTGNPVIAESHTMDGTGIGTFTSLLTGLTAGTVYYVRAYASNSSGTSYGNEVTFTTPGNPIVLTTSLVTDISQNTASGGGNVISDGGIPVIAKGICWSPISAPTLSDSHTVDGNGTGSFIGNLTGLSPSTLYYVRAYAYEQCWNSIWQRSQFFRHSGLTALDFPLSNMKAKHTIRSRWEDNAGLRIT